jgi:DNA polymerase I-like protein with 3'-5' exonuclease and polymerase domains
MKQGIKSPCDNNLYPGGLSSRTFVSYARGFGIDMTEQESEDLRNAWLRAFPEMGEYLQPEPQPDDPGKYVASTNTGRVRGYCSYTEANNTPFQGLASDGAKEALWLLFRNHNSTVNFVHDETLSEIRKTEPGLASAQVDNISELMIKGMQKVVRDVPISVEAALMDRWYKEAKPVHDAEGNLIPWKPETEEK